MDDEFDLDEIEATFQSLISRCRNLKNYQGWAANELNEMARRIVQLQGCLVAVVKPNLCDALTIMDEKGKRNAENNSRMLWFKDWDHLRELLLEAYDDAKSVLESEE